MAKRPPTNTDAEAAVLATSLIDEEAFFEIRDQLHHKDFYHGRFQTIWKAINELADKDRRIDHLTLMDYLLETGRLEDAGNYVGLSDLMGRVSTSANVQHHVDIVKRWTARRKLMIEAKSMLSKINYSSKDPDDPQKFAFEIAHRLMEVASGFTDDGLKPLDKVIDELIDRTHDKEDGSGWWITGCLFDFYRYFRGYCPNQYVVVAGRPSMGKTALAINESLNVAKRIGQHGYVHFFSLESSATQILQRILAVHLDMKYDDVMEAGSDLLYEWLDRDLGNVRELRDIPIAIDDTAGLTPIDIDARITRYKSRTRRPVRMVVIDYLQMVGPSVSKKGRSREEEVKQISQEIRALGKKHQCTMMVLAQLNRGPEGREPPIPRCSDLRESGSLEQDADVIMLIYRPIRHAQFYKSKKHSVKGCDFREYCSHECDDQCKGVPEDACQILIDKVRDGKTGQFVCWFDQLKQTFRNANKSDKDGQSDYKKSAAGDTE